MKKIMLIGLIGFIGLISNSISANTKIVSGNGSASCPAGYIVTGVVPSENTLTNSYYSNFCSMARSGGNSNGSNSPHFSGCSTVTSNSVSNCNYVANCDTQIYQGDSERPRWVLASLPANIKLICAKSCGN